MKDSIIRTIILSAPIERVWQALSDHREFGTWFRAAIPDPFVVGATISCQSTYPGHEHLTWEMTIVVMEMNRQLVMSWPAYYGEDSDRDASDDPYLTITFDIESCAEGTRLVLTESGFAALPTDYAPAAYRLSSGGWDEQMKNIVAHIVSDDMPEVSINAGE